MDLAHGVVESWDGTRIAYQAAGPVGAPAVLLANGLGGDVTAWRFVIEALADRYRILSWDYRGLFRSGPPPDDRTLGPREQARDVAPILAAEKIDRFALFGWSMGVQVSLELYRAFGDRVAALGVINGVPGRPFDTALGWRFSRHVAPLLVGLLRRKHGLVGQVTRWGVGWRGILPAMQRLGMIGPTLDGEVFRQVAAQFARLDFRLYYATMEALGRHDAWDVVPTVRAPTTIIAGDRDLLTPMEVARKMARAIEGARLVVLPGATHYTPVEQPEAVVHEATALLDRAGW